MADLQMQVYTSVHKLDRLRWQALHRESGVSRLLDWGFLALLEDSKAVGAAAGWEPLYAVLSQGTDWLAAAPLYLVAGQDGQFTWDGGMDELASAFRESWYPKLVGMVPFTPLPLWQPLALTTDYGLLLLRLLADMAKDAGMSGIHCQWLDQGFASVLGRTAVAGQDGAGQAATGIAPWLGWQRQAFIWTNPGFEHFDDYLGGLSKNMRRNVRRERQGLAQAGLEIRMLAAGSVDDSYWTSMADYYSRTNDKYGPWAARFLPRAFFELAPEYIADFCRFSVARRQSDPEGRPVALALFYEDRGRLLGRYWGCESEWPGLHFELCYYQPIEYAIDRGLVSVDPGMGGDHKARRGFTASLVTSRHQVFNRHLARIFSQAITQASAAEAAYVDQLNSLLPQG